MLRGDPNAHSHSLPAAAQNRAAQLRERFRAHVGRYPTHEAFAPGRANLIGEYTDFNGGFVLPFAIGLGIFVVARKRDDKRVRIWSAQMGGEPLEFDLYLPIGRGERGWGRYVRGVMSGLLEAGIEMPGFDAVVDATLPMGSGLSSSAALEAAMASLGESLAGAALDPKQKALLCQKAEHVFAGTPCGIMDQFTVILGKPGHLLLIDCRSLEHELVPMASDDVTLFVIDTMVRHTLVDGGYASRRDDCFAAAKLLGIELLRDATPQSIAAGRAILPERVFGRARHVVTENERTLAAADAVRRGDWRELGRLMYASHESLRANMEVSCKELDAIVETAKSIGEAGGIYGCRMTGGGFGGCCVAVVQKARAKELRTRFEEKNVKVVVGGTGE